MYRFKPKPKPNNKTKTKTKTRQVNPYPGLGEVGGPLVLESLLLYYSQA